MRFHLFAYAAFTAATAAGGHYALTADYVWPGIVLFWISGFYASLILIELSRPAAILFLHHQLEWRRREMIDRPTLRNCNRFAKASRRLYEWKYPAL